LMPRKMRGSGDLEFVIHRTLVVSMDGCVGQSIDGIALG